MDILKTTAKGIAWTTVSSIVRSIVSLVQVSILTRFLAKGDFGIVAIANLFIGFTGIFLDMGLSVGIMHRNDTTPQQYSSLFWLNIFAGITLTTILCFVSPLAAHFYHEPELTKVLMLLSLSVFFSSLGSQHRTVQQKRMRFKYIALIEITTLLLSMALAIVFAVSGAGLYSIVYSSLFHSLSASLLFLIIGLVKDHNISFHFKLSETYDYLKIGVYSMGSQILDFFSRESDILIISATLGTEIVGVYSLCKRLVLSIYNTVNPIINRVITPVIAELQEQKQRVRNLYLTLTETLSLVYMPVYCLLAVFAFGILNFIYGPDYVDGTVVLQFVALSYGITASCSLIGSLQTAYGRTDLGFYWTICRIVLTVLAVYVGSLFGLNAIAFALLALNIVNNPLFFRITIYPIIGYGYSEYYRKTIFVGFVVIAFSLPFYLFCNHMTNVIICLGIGVVYSVLYALLVLWLFPKSYLVRLAKEKIGSLRDIDYF